MTSLSVILGPEFDELASDPDNPQYDLLLAILVTADGAVVEYDSQHHGPVREAGSCAVPVPEVASGPCGSDAKVAVSVWFDDEHLSAEAAHGLLTAISSAIAASDAYQQLPEPTRIHLAAFSGAFAIERIMPEV